jgi:integrase
VLANLSIINGTPRDKDNARAKVMGPIVRRANEFLAERDAMPLPKGLTPHKLRHTAASVLPGLGRDPAYVVAQLGHSDPKSTLRVYAHVMRRDDGERMRLRQVVEGRPDRLSPLSPDSAAPVGRETETART